MVKMGKWSEGESKKMFMTGVGEEVGAVITRSRIWP